MDYYIVTDDYYMSSDFLKIKSIFNNNDKLYLIAKNSDRCTSEKNLPAFDKIFDLNIINLKNIEEIILDNSKKISEVRLATRHEKCLLMLSEFRKKFNIPGSKENQIHPFVNKKIMKDMISENHIMAKYFFFEKENNSKLLTQYKCEIEEQIPYPMFYKPVAGTTSIDAKKIENSTELDLFLKRKDHSPGGYLIEEYLDSEIMFECDSIISNGEILISFVSRYSYPCTWFSKGYPAIVKTLSFNHEHYEKLISLNKKIIQQFSKKITIPNCVTHLEAMLMKNGDLKFIEIAARPPGPVPFGSVELYKNIYDVHLEEIHLLLDFSIPVNVDITDNKKNGAFLYFPNPEGYIKNFHKPSLNSSEIIYERINIDYEKKYQKPFDLRRLSDNSCYALGLLANSYDDLCKEIYFIESTIKIETH